MITFYVRYFIFSEANNASPNRQRKSFITKFKDKFKETGNHMKKKIKNFLNYKGTNSDEDEDDEMYLKFLN